MARTHQDFVTNGDPWSVIEGWMLRNGFSLSETYGSRRVYLNKAPTYGGQFWIDATVDGNRVHLEMWIKCLGLPGEMAIHKLGMLGLAAKPKAEAAKLVSTLYAELGP